MLQSGARIDLDQTIEERRDGQLVRTRHRRVQLALGAPSPDGSNEARAVVIFVHPDATEERLLFDLRLDRDLTARAGAVAACEGHRLSDEAWRIVRHVLRAVPRPFPSVRTGSTFSGEVWDERLDRPLRAQARLRVREPGRIRITADAELPLDGVHLAGAVATGTARVRVIAELDDSLVVGTTRTRIETSDAIRESEEGDATTHSARLRVDERIVAVHARGALHTWGLCERSEPGAGFAARLVVRMVETRQAAVRACYNRELRADRSLSGSIRVRLIVLEDGALGDVEATENTTGNEALAACVVDVLSRPFRFSPAPVGGSVTFQFPFVFRAED